MSCCKRIPGFARLQGGFSSAGLDPFDGYFKEPVIGAEEPTVSLCLDLREPTIQLLPITAAGVNDIIGRTPSTIYDFEEAAGNPVVDRLGATANLTLVTFQRNPFQEQIALGLWDGASLTYKKAIEFYVLAQGAFDSPNVLDHDETDQSFAWGVMWRHYRTSSQLNMFGKKSNLLVGSPGWLVIEDGGGRIQIHISDGLTTASEGSAEDTSDGGWNLTFLVVNRATNLMTIVNQRASTAGTDISAIGSITNATPFHIGRNPSGSLSSNGVQYAWMVKFQGNEVEKNGGLGLADVQALWNHAAEPTGLLTFTRNSPQAEIIGSDAGGLNLAEYGAGQFPMGYNAGWSHATKLAYRPARTLTNLITNSDTPALYGWTYSNMTFRRFGFDNTNEESPRHLYECGILLSSAANGYAESSPFVVTPSTMYTTMLFYKRSDSMAADVTGAWIAWDKTANVQIASQAITATALWQVVTYQFTTPVGCISAAMRLSLDLISKRITPFRMVVCEGEIAAPITASGGAATMAPTLLRLANADTYVKGATGEITATCLGDYASVLALNQHLIDVRNGVGNEDRRNLYIQADEELRTEVYDRNGVSAGAVDSAVYAWNVERIARMQWNRSGSVPLAPPGSRVANSVNPGAVVGGVAASWDAEDNADTASIGSDGTAVPANQFCGGISYACFHTKPIP